MSIGVYLQLHSPVRAGLRFPAAGSSPLSGVLSHSGVYASQSCGEPEREQPGDEHGSGCGAQVLEPLGVKMNAAKGSNRIQHPPSIIFPGPYRGCE